MTLSIPITLTVHFSHDTEGDLHEIAAALTSLAGSAARYVADHDPQRVVGLSVKTGEPAPRPPTVVS